MCVMGFIASQSTSYMSVLLPSGTITIINLCLALVLVHFSLLKSLRTRKTKTIFGVLGSCLVVLSLIGFVFPTYFGLIYLDENPINLLIMLVNGLGFLTASIEPSRERNLKQFISPFVKIEKIVLSNLVKLIQIH